MRLVRASVLALALGSCPELGAQPADVQVQTIGALHMAALQAREGIVRVYVSSDASAGDTIAGLMIAEPAGGTPQAREANLARLYSFFVEWQDRRTAVSVHRYEWPIPRTMRTGTGTLLLRDGQGETLSRAQLPVDPVPFPPAPESSQAPVPVLPVEGQGGMTAVVRGAFDGRLTGKALTLGTTEAQLLAASPRQLVFQVPTRLSGPLPLRVGIQGQAPPATASFRVFDVQSELPSPAQGQQGRMRVTVSGLTGITAPVLLTLRNRSTAVISVENIERPIVIEPRQVTPQGTFVATRQFTARGLGTAQVAVTVASRPLGQFDMARHMTRTLTAWKARTGVGIGTEADTAIRRSVVATQTMLDDFLAGQQSSQGDVQAVLAALVGAYCFDLRDDNLNRRPSTLAGLAFPGVVLAAFGQSQTGPEITPVEVGLAPFADFLSRLVSLVRDQQPVGYLFVSSTPVRALIALDGKQSGQMTNRRFVTIAGKHDVAISAARPCRESVTVTSFQTKAVDCGS